MSLLFLSPILDGYQATDDTGQPLPLAELTFWRAGTTAKQAIYSDQALATEHDNPLIADANGEFPLIFLGSAHDYRIRLQTADGVLRWDVDPYVCDCTDPPYIFRTPIHQAIADDTAVPGATLTFSLTETETPTNTYTDARKKVPHPNPLTADAGGFFPVVYMDDAITYRVILAGDTELEDIDPYVCACGSTFLTSRPYPVEVIEAVNVTSMSLLRDHPQTGIGPEALSVAMTLLSGTLETPLAAYEIPPEAVDVSMSLLSGSLEIPLVDYEAAPEAVDVTMTLLSGTLESPLVTYEMETEAVDVTMTLLSGTLT